METPNLNNPESIHERRCTATSKQSGKQCGRYAIPGGNVCIFHGGGAPQVKRAAQIRLAALVDPAIDRLEKLLDSKIDAVKLAAAKDVLDRSGLKPTEKIEAAVSVLDPQKLAEMPDDQLSTAISLGKLLAGIRSGAEEAGEESFTE